MGTPSGHNGTGSDPFSSLVESVGRQLAPTIARELLEGLQEDAAAELVADPRSAWTWRERLWIAPGETRIGVEELAEAVGRPLSWVYRHTSPKALEKSGADALPHRKLDGVLLFVVAEVRAWIRDHEETISAGRLEPAAWERDGGLRVVG